MLGEILGSFVLVFFFMTQTDEKMLFSSEKAINCFIIASSYIAARAMFNQSVAGACTTAEYIADPTCTAGAVTNHGACLNPAIALGLVVGNLFTDYAGETAKWVWLYGATPFIGSVIALVFYEFVYKKTQEMLNHDGQETEEEVITEGTLD